MGFLTDQSKKTEYNIGNLYVALCTVTSDLEYDMGPKFYEQFYILAKDPDDNYTEFFTGTGVLKVQMNGSIFEGHWNTPYFCSGVIAPVSKFVFPGTYKLNLSSLFYLQNSLNAIYIPNNDELEAKYVFDIFLGEKDIADCLNMK